MSNQRYVDVVYNEKDKPFTDYPSKMIKYLIKKYNITEESKVLELGCGRGEFLNEFYNNNMISYGVDISSYAKEKFPHLNISSVDMLKNSLPYPDNSFDVIYSKSFVEHFYYPEKIFQEAYRVLKKGGRIITLTPEWKYYYKTFYEDYTHRTPFTKLSLKDIHLINKFENFEVESFRQLPFLWNMPIILKNVFIFLSQLTRIFAPDVFREKNVKWIRWSKEIMLLSSAKK